MSLTQHGLDVLKAFEKCRLTAYQDQGGSGVWTIGWGHTGAEVGPGLQWDQEHADEVLVDDLAHFVAGVSRLLTQGAIARLTGDQFSSLVLLAFNIGLSHFGSSSVLRFTNAGMPEQAAEAFLMWTRLRGPDGALRPSDGLLRRRQAEVALWRGQAALSEALPA